MERAMTTRPGLEVDIGDGAQRCRNVRIGVMVEQHVHVS